MTGEILSRTVSEIIGILDECGYSDEANWLSKRLAVLSDPSATADALEHARNELHTVVPGMGGLLDLDLTPRAGSAMTPERARERMDSLATVLFEGTR